MVVGAATTDASRAHLYALPYACAPVEELADGAAAQPPSHEPEPEQPVCAICFGPLSVDIARSFPNSSCPHEFCAECLAKLLATKKSEARLPSQATDELAPPVLCPQCRRPASTELVALLAWLPVTSTPIALTSPSVDALPSSGRPSISRCCVALIAFTITPALWWSIGIIVNELQKY